MKLVTHFLIIFKYTSFNVQIKGIMFLGAFKFGVVIISYVLKEVCSGIIVCVCGNTAVSLRYGYFCVWITPEAGKNTRSVPCTKYSLYIITSYHPLTHTHAHTNTMSHSSPLPRFLFSTADTSLASTAAKVRQQTFGLVLSFSKKE